MKSGETILKITDVHKAFGPVIALRGVSFEVHRGEISGLIGENGSGKSTVTSIVAGMQKKDSGEMFFKGGKWEPSSMIDAQRKGVSMILQEMNTIPGVTVAENLFAGKEDQFSKFGFVNRHRMAAAAQERLDSFGLSNIRARDPIDKYGFEERKLIELVRCVGDGTELLVVDETTTALSYNGRLLLYDLIGKMASQGKAVIFISHDLDEIMRVCSAVTVLRDGEIVGHLEKEEYEAARIRFMMVGREIGDAYYREDFTPSHKDEIVLDMRNVSFGNINDFSMQVHAGEIVGIGGLSGCGMHDIGRLAFGIEKPKSGGLTVHGQKIDGCGDAIEKGASYISKNRDQEALILAGSIGDNIVLPSLKRLTQKLMFISPFKEKKLAKAQVDALAIKCHSVRQYVDTLSGGQQAEGFLRQMDCDQFLTDDYGLSNARCGRWRQAGHVPPDRRTQRTG